jgi:hypothetical protein
MCVYVSVRERNSVCACVFDRCRKWVCVCVCLCDISCERDIGSEFVCLRERERYWQCVCVCACVYTCVCVCARMQNGESRLTVNIWQHIPIPLLPRSYIRASKRKIRDSNVSSASDLSFFSQNKSEVKFSFKYFYKVCMKYDLKLLIPKFIKFAAVAVG